jgi:hypothetical protein
VTIAGEHPFSAHDPETWRPDFGPDHAPPWTFRPLVVAGRPAVHAHRPEFAAEFPPAAVNMKAPGRDQ